MFPMTSSCVVYGLPYYVLPVFLKHVYILSRKHSCSWVSIGSLEAVVHDGVSSSTATRSGSHCDVVTTWMIKHYTDVITGAMASQITSLTSVYSTVYSGADHRRIQSSASLAFVWEIHRWPVNSPHKWPVTRKMFSFDDVIMTYEDPLWLMNFHS